MTQLNENLGLGRRGRGRPRTSIETVPSGQGYAPLAPHSRAMGGRTALRLPIEMDLQLRAIAKQEGTSSTAIVRCALEAYFSYRSAQTI